MQEGGGGWVERDTYGSVLSAKHLQVQNKDRVLQLQQEDRTLRELKVHKQKSLSHKFPQS